MISGNRTSQRTLSLVYLFRRNNPSSLKFLCNFPGVCFSKIVYSYPLPPTRASLDGDIEKNLIFNFRYQQIGKELVSNCKKLASKKNPKKIPHYPLKTKTL